MLCSIACNVSNKKQVHVDFNTGPTYQVSKRRAPGNSQHRLSVVRNVTYIAFTALYPPAALVVCESQLTIGAYSIVKFLIVYSNFC